MSVMSWVRILALNVGRWIIFHIYLLQNRIDVMKTEDKRRNDLFLSQLFVAKIELIF